MMAKLFFVPLTLAVAFAASPGEKKATPEWGAAVRPAKVPAAAVQVDDYTWRLVDKDGKAWLYRRTPFGVVKIEDKPSPLADATESLKVTERGDEVTFERRTPFTTYRWTKKASELDGTEKAALEHARSGSEAHAAQGAARGARKQEK